MEADPVLAVANDMYEIFQDLLTSSEEASSKQAILIASSIYKMVVQRKQHDRSLSIH